MSSVNKTENYGLNQWEGNEFPKRSDFVQDNLIIDGILKDHEVSIGERAKIAKTFTVSLVSNAWVGSAAPFTQTVTLEGIKQIDVPFVDVILSNDNVTAIAEESAYSNISKVSTADGSILVRCNKKKPSVNLNLILRVVG